MEKKNFDSSNDCNMAMRQLTSQELLEKLISRLAEEAVNLQALKDSLPAKLPREAERALCALITKAGRI